MTLHASDLAILLVEPSSTQLKVIVRELEEQGVTQIEAVNTAEAALINIEQYTPDLVITSMYLPDMDAISLIEKARSKVENLAFMMVSSETDVAALEPIRQAGVLAILPKPFHHQDLERAIAATLDVLEPTELILENIDITLLEVLLVDDSLTSLNQLRRVVESMGFEHITLASNGQEAANVLTQKPIDIVFSDHNMPIMTGEDLVKHIRVTLGDAVIPIIIATSEHDMPLFERLEKAGATAVLGKPYEVDKIKQVLSNLYN
jgi:two-component system chemotaxis response regulator CheY